MTPSETFTLELPTQQLGAAYLYPPRRITSRDNGEPLNALVPRRFPAWGAPRKRRATWRGL